MHYTPNSGYALKKAPPVLSWEDQCDQLAILCPETVAIRDTYTAILTSSEDVTAALHYIQNFYELVMTPNTLLCCAVIG